MTSDLGDDYVEIVRYVQDLNDDKPADAATRRFLRAYRPDGGETLEGLLRVDTLDPIVLVAPSGSGKSTELRHLARRLRSAGREAVFSEACGVLHPSEMDLAKEEREALTKAS